MKRLDKNLLKFEKLWRNMTGIQRKSQKVVTFAVPPKQKALPPKPKAKNITKSKSYVQPKSARSRNTPLPLRNKANSSMRRHRRSSSIPFKFTAKRLKSKSERTLVKKKKKEPNKELPVRTRPRRGHTHNQTVTGLPPAAILGIVEDEKSSENHRPKKPRHRKNISLLLDGGNSKCRELEHKDLNIVLKERFLKKINYFVKR